MKDVQRRPKTNILIFIQVFPIYLWLLLLLSAILATGTMMVSSRALDKYEPWKWSSLIKESLLELNSVSQVSNIKIGYYYQTKNHITSGVRLVKEMPDFGHSDIGNCHARLLQCGLDVKHDRHAESFKLGLL